MVQNNFDWRNYFTLSSVLDQGKCQSCWALATVTCFADVIQIKRNGHLLPVFDIVTFSKETKSPKQKTVGEIDICFGGSMITPTLEKMKSFGCLLKNGERKYPKDILEISSNFEEHILECGPVITTMEIYDLPEKYKLENHTNGIYGHGWYHQLKKPIIAEYHVVVLVGWGVLDGIKYWIARNSWGTSFGEKGYFKIIRSKNFSKIEQKGFAFLI